MANSDAAKKVAAERAVKREQQRKEVELWRQSTDP
jgi:hypothetical protein